jgi:2-polyprenyl-3-methyl-5-hydroxy-6-metoxy-1,4-benzoquinol methylase
LHGSTLPTVTRRARSNANFSGLLGLALDAAELLATVDRKMLLLPLHPAFRDTTGFYKLQDFLAGRGSIGEIEAKEIGDIRGKRLLHLQCHFGLDTLMLARAGAEVTGLDFSPRAIVAARELAARAKIIATFVEGNVDDAPTLTPGPFDIVFTTWGTIVWLPDIARWARVIATVLSAGGFLYFADGHPMLQAGKYTSKCQGRECRSGLPSSIVKPTRRPQLRRGQASELNG